MAVFFHNNCSIAYISHYAPFSQDLLLLQDSGQNSDFWDLVIADLKDMPVRGGRITTCAWTDAGKSIDEQAENMRRLVQTLGLVSPYVVACDDAVQLVNAMEGLEPSLFGNKRFSSSTLGDENLVKLIREFCQV